MGHFVSANANGHRDGNERRDGFAARRLDIRRTAAVDTPEQGWWGMVVHAHGRVQQKAQVWSDAVQRTGEEEHGSAFRVGFVECEELPLLALERDAHGVHGLIDPDRVKGDGIVLRPGPAKDLLVFVRRELGGKLAEAGYRIAFGKDDVDRKLKGERLRDLLQALLDEGSA